MALFAEPLVNPVHQGLAKANESVALGGLTYAMNEEDPELIFLVDVLEFPPSVIWLTNKPSPFHCQRSV
jgi:hypothetical protein